MFLSCQNSVGGVERTEELFYNLTDFCTRLKVLFTEFKWYDKAGPQTALKMDKNETADWILKSLFHHLNKHLCFQS